MEREAKKEQEAKREGERTEAELTHLRRRFQEAAVASANDRTMLKELLRERERVDAEHKQQLADLARQLQDRTSTYAAHRMALEQEMKELRDRVATAITTPALYVQVLFCPPTHDG